MADKKRNDCSGDAAQTGGMRLNARVNGPSFGHDDVYGPEQTPEDRIDEALMESFPCSDPPSYSSGHV